MSILRATALSKRFGRHTALRPLDLEVPENTVLGLLGVNGSGKSTLIKLAAGISAPSGGRIEILGRAPGPHTKLHVAYMPEVDHLYPSWTARDAYRFHARFFPMNPERFTRLLDFLQVHPDTRMAQLSKGNRTRVRLAVTLAREARLYLLDEPRSGIDPLTRESLLRALIGEFPPEASVVLATHQVSEAESLFDHVLVLDHGQVLLSGPADEIRADHRSSIDRALKDAARAAQDARPPVNAREAHE